MDQILTPPAAMHVAALKPLKTSYRINSIDLLRGLVMIIMALDHTRDFFHTDAMVSDPLNLAITTPLLFFTRWITHFCAPVFVFLAGTSAFFQKARKTKRELSGFLISRGLWLIFVEVAVISLAIFFDPGYHSIALQTIWAIGISMVLLGLAIWLPYKAIFALALLIVLGHNSLDFFEAGKPQGSFSVLYSLLHVQGFFPLSEDRNLLVLYPFLPWMGLMLGGYCFGKLFSMYEGVQRRTVLTWLGLGIIAFFIVLRATNLYGNPEEWSNQKNALYTFLSFIDTRKYPPSLLYMCMTIGPAILFIAWVGNTKTVLAKFTTVYGRVPFFYYVLHFFLIHLLSTIAFVARGHSLSEPTPQGLGIKYLVPGEGYNLWVVYGVWIFVVLALYPLCKWFSDYKKTHTQWWLSYL